MAGSWGAPKGSSVLAWPWTNNYLVYILQPGGPLVTGYSVDPGSCAVVHNQDSAGGARGTCLRQLAR